MRLARAAALAVAMALGLASAGATQEVDLTLDEARILAQRAYLAGELPLAQAIALRLLEADPDDARALLILSATATQLGDPAQGREAGRAAWAAAGADEPQGMRYDIARHTALAAWHEGRLSAAQFWLRRAADSAPSDAEYRQTVSDYRMVRARNPLRFSASLSVTPTSNLNGGAASGDLTIDDWFHVGPQYGTALALSGTRTVAQARMSYVLAAGERGQTTLGLRAIGAFHSLSSEAKAIAGGISGQYLNAVTLEASLRRDTLWPGGAHPLSLTVAAGQNWEGGEVAGPHLRLEAETPLLRREGREIWLGARADVHSLDDDDTLSMGIALESMQAALGGQIGWAISMRDVQGGGVNRSFRSLTGEVSYAPAAPIGPVRLRGGLQAGLRDYPEYRLGPFGVSDGREDISLGLSLDMVMEGTSFLGHAPKVTLSALATDSNISRFETRQLGISFGFESRF